MTGDPVWSVAGLIGFAGLCVVQFSLGHDVWAAMDAFVAGGYFMRLLIETAR